MVFHIEIFSPKCKSRDPFQLPSNPQDKQKAHECKAKFARDSYSDHMAYLKAFQVFYHSKIVLYLVFTCKFLVCL